MLLPTISCAKPISAPRSAKNQLGCTWRTHSGTTANIPATSMRLSAGNAKSRPTILKRALKPMRVHIYDDFPPETSAMMQALYSRSPLSVVEHARKAREKGPHKFMESYYVGYGHASIGDCGVTTLYLEDVSLLACKAVQDNALYSGQETSTRYIDFSKQRVHDPIGSSKSEALLRRWVEFYSEHIAQVIAHLQKQFPLPADQKLNTWEKAIKARAFDIMRGFLPAGVTSQLSWTTNLRQAHEQLLRLGAHPLSEVKALAVASRAKLLERYPSSFGHKVNEEELDYLRLVADTETYLVPSRLDMDSSNFEVATDVSNARLEAEALAVIANRPRKSQLPRTLARFGQYQCHFVLDFGSFRDLQRHRMGICRMPLLTSELGFNSWYLDQLPFQIRTKAERFIVRQVAETRAITENSCDRYDEQYFHPLGMNVQCELVYDLPQMVYVSELRSNTTVHPTLRWVAQNMAQFLRGHHPKLALFADLSPSALSIHRGTQDIVERTTAA